MFYINSPKLICLLVWNVEIKNIEVVVPPKKASHPLCLPPGRSRATPDVLAGRVHFADRTSNGGDQPSSLVRMQ